MLHSPLVGAAGCAAHSVCSGQQPPSVMVHWWSLQGAGRCTVPAKGWQWLLYLPQVSVWFSYSDLLTPSSPGSWAGRPQCLPRANCDGCPYLQSVTADFCQLCWLALVLPVHHYTPAENSSRSQCDQAAQSFSSLIFSHALALLSHPLLDTACLSAVSSFSLLFLLVSLLDCQPLQSPFLRCTLGLYTQNRASTQPVLPPCCRHTARQPRLQENMSSPQASRQAHRQKPSCGECVPAPTGKNHALSSTGQPTCNGVVPTKCTWALPEGPSTTPILRSACKRTLHSSQCGYNSIQCLGWRLEPSSRALTIEFSHIWLGSGPRYMICVTRSARCTSQKTYGRSRIAHYSSQKTYYHARIALLREHCKRFSHGSRFCD